MIQKIGLYLLVILALIAVIKQPDAIGDFFQAISASLRAVANALSELFGSVS